MSGRNKWPVPGKPALSAEYLEQEKRLIDAQLRTVGVESILFRNQIFGLKTTPEEADSQFVRHFLESGMTFDEACEVLHSMVKNNYRLKLKHETKT